MKGIILNSSYYFKFFIIILSLFFFSSCDGITPTAPIIHSFTADDTTIDEGESVSLSWTVTDATSVTINQGIGSVALSGSTSVSPAETTTYSLTATNSAGSTIATVTVTVNEEPIKLLVNGDFSTCDFTGWTISESGILPTITYKPSGCGVLMGDGGENLYDGVTNTASIQQVVDIPLDAIDPTLILQYVVTGTDEDGEGYDWMKVYINSTEVFYVWEDSCGWQEFQYDLSSYIGTSIILKISAWTLDDKSPVYYDVDDIFITWD